MNIYIFESKYFYDEFIGWLLLETQTKITKKERAIFFLFVVIVVDFI